jgi:Domain of unknown function (DUF4845)
MRTIRQQRGMTMISWLMVAGIAAFIGKFFFALLPSFMEQARLDTVLEGARVEYQDVSSTPTKQDMRRSVERRMDINDVRSLTIQDMQFMSYDGLTWIGFEFEQRVEFMGKVSLVVSYNNWIPIGGGPEVGARSNVDDGDGDGG